MADRQTSGQVRVWHDEEGWGVIDTMETPGGCWAHFAVVEGEGYKSLRKGARVEVAYEHGSQDGYDYRATWVREFAT